MSLSENLTTFVYNLENEIMNRLFKYLLILIVSILFFSCQSDDGNDDCTKTITIPQYYIVNNQTYSYDTTLEVPCDFPEPEEPELIEPPLLENFTYDVLNFNFTPDTGNNTSRLQFEIQLNNANDYTANGVPILTINTDGLEFSGSFSNNASNPCFQIDDNSSCILAYDVEESLDIGIINSVELVTVEYYLIN